MFQKFYLNKILLIFLVLILSSKVFCQVKIKVIDSISKEVLPFTLVSVNDKNGFYTNTDGILRLDLDYPIRKIKFSYIGYNDKVIVYNNQKNILVKLSSSNAQLKEFVLNASENPANRIIRKAIENKELNNHENINYQCNLYSKMLLNADNIDTAKENKLMENEPDSVLSLSETNDSIYFFIIENQIERKHLKPNNTKEKIIASRVSGFKNPGFIALATQLQKFSIYSNYFLLLEKNYVSPIHQKALKYYYYQIEDTSFVDNDTVFHLSFIPKYNKSFDALTGIIYINTHNYAVQNVVAKPKDSNSDLNISITQQYQIYQDKWFPKELKADLIMPNLLLVADLKAEVRTVINDIEYDPSNLSKKEFKINLEIGEEAEKKDESVWNNIRMEDSLSEKEKNSYKVIDSIGEAENFDKALTTFENLAQGKIRVLKYFNIDLVNLFNYNLHEGFRLQGGLSTNDNLSKLFSVGGYFAYGFKDKKTKWGGDFKINLDRRNNFYIKFTHNNDIIARGIDELSERSYLFYNNGYRQIYLEQFDKVEKWQLSVNYAIKDAFLTPYFNTQSIQSLDYYRFLEDNSASKNWKFTEAGIQVRYQANDRRFFDGKNLVSYGSKYPIIYAKLSIGIPDLLDGDYEYQKFTLETSHSFAVSPNTTFYYNIGLGLITGDVPLTLLSKPWGTLSDGALDYVAVDNGFETMQINEFFSDKYVYSILSFDYAPFKHKKFSPSFRVHQNMIIGDLNSTDMHIDGNFRTLNDLFVESGFSIRNIIKLGFSSLGAGVYYRYGPYQLPDLSDNLKVKLTTAFSF